MVTPNTLAEVLQIAGRIHDRVARSPDAHSALLSEVYEAAETKLKVQLDTLPQEQVIGLLTQEFRCASGRERYRRTRCITIHEDSVLTTGDPTRSLGGSTSRNPLDELIQREDCRRLIARLEHLSANEQALLLTLRDSGPTHLTLGTLARQEGVSVRTLQRRRKELCDRLRRELEGAP
jgi:hypothetical protein